MIDGHGDDIFRYGGKIQHNFSSNICQNIHLDALMQHLASSTSAVANYPEPAPDSLEKLLAERIGVAPENIVVTNGATEAIYLIAQAFAGSTSAVVQPTFSEYADACGMFGHKVVNVDSFEDLGFFGKLEKNEDVENLEKVENLESLENLAHPHPHHLLWLCNPNNPTGTVVPAADLRRAVKGNPRCLFVIDQAYHLYTSQPLLSPSEATAADNLLLLYSLTKDFCIPGLRLGFAVGNADIIARVKSRRIPWSVNGIAIEAAKFLIAHAADYTIPTSSLCAEARRIATALNALGIETSPTQTNYLLCRLPKGIAAALKQYLAEQRAILIRDASNFHGLTLQHFRIAAQSPEENNLLIRAIAEWLENHAVCSSGTS